MNPFILPRMMVQICSLEETEMWPLITSGHLIQVVAFFKVAYDELKDAIN